MRVGRWLLLALAALAAVLAVVPTMSLPRYDAFSRVWLIDDSGTSYDDATGTAVIGEVLSPTRAKEVIRAAGLRQGTPDAADRWSFDINPEGLAEIHLVDEDPRFAMQVVQALADEIALVHPNCKVIPPSEPERALLPGGTLAKGLALFAGLVGLTLVVLAAARQQPLGWRGLLVASLVAAQLQGGAFGGLLPSKMWLAFQLVPLAAAGIALRPWQFRLAGIHRAEWVAIVGWFALVVTAAATSPWSLAPRRSLAQAAVLAAYGLFLVLVLLRRWRRRQVLAGDVATLVAACAAPTVVAAVVLGSGRAHWPLSPISGRFQGYWFNPNALGLVAAGLCLASLAFLGRLGQPGRSDGRWQARAWWAGAAAFLGVVTLLTGSRGALGGLVLGIVLLAASLGGRRLALWAAAGSAALLAVGILATWQLGIFVRAGDVFVDSGRRELWHEALERFRSSPWIGVGFRTGNSDGVTYTFHNIYLSVLAELGIVGMAAFVALVVGLVWAGWRARAGGLLGVVAGLGFAELYDSSMLGFLGPVALTCWLLVFAHAALGSAKVDGPGATSARFGRSREAAGTSRPESPGQE